MTGEPFEKQRVILSEKILSERSGHFDPDRIVSDFLEERSSDHRIVSVVYDLSVKADPASASSQDSDGKKRTNSGGVPGMVETDDGYRYMPSEKAGPGKVLALHPSERSRRAVVNKKPNFGWIDEGKDITPEQYVREISEIPAIRLTKYQVNEKTGKVIESSGRVLSPFSLSGDKYASNRDYEQKRLPGLPLRSRGRSLIARAAARFGILTDADGKFRCPPGTPAANQFTDFMGSTCFGRVASQILDSAVSSGKMSQDKASRIGNTVRNISNFLYDVDNAAYPGLGRTIWRDDEGRKIKNIRKWKQARYDERSKPTVDGLARAEARLEQQDREVKELLTELGVDTSDERREDNSDVWEAIEILQQTGKIPTEVSGRLSKSQIQSIATARLRKVRGFDKLSPEQQRRLIDADTNRFISIERMMLESMLDQFISDPASVAMLDSFNFVIRSPKDSENEGFTAFSPTGGGVFAAKINIDIPFIMGTQEETLPHLFPMERLRVDAPTAKTDAEAAAFVADYLLGVDIQSKQVVAMVDERMYARHIFKHEFGHVVQGKAFFEKIREHIDANGEITFKSPRRGVRTVSSIDDLTGQDVYEIMASNVVGANLDALGDVTGKTDAVMFLAGSYPLRFNEEGEETIKYIEAGAELWALREAGMIHGDAVDDALSYMDRHVDGKYSLDRDVRDSLAANDPSGAIGVLSRRRERAARAQAEVARRNASRRRKQVLDEYLENVNNAPIDDVLENAKGIQELLASRIERYEQRIQAGEAATSIGMLEEKDEIDMLKGVLSSLQKMYVDRSERIGDPDSKKNAKAKFKSEIERVLLGMDKLPEGRKQEIIAEDRLNQLAERIKDSSADEISAEISQRDVDLASSSGMDPFEKSVTQQERDMLYGILRKKVTDEEGREAWSKRRKEIERTKKDAKIINSTENVEEQKKILRKRRLDQFQSEISEQGATKDSIAERAAELTVSYEEMLADYKKRLDSGVPKDSPDMLESFAQIKETEEMLKIAQKSYVDKFSIPESGGESRSKRELGRLIEAKRFEAGTLSPERRSEMAREREITSLRERAQEMSDEEIISYISDLRESGNVPGTNSAALGRISEDQDVLSSVLKDRAIARGGKQEWEKVRKDVRKAKSPPRQKSESSKKPTKPKKLSTNRSAENLGTRERTALVGKLSYSESRAFAEIADTRRSYAGQMLTPETMDEALSAVDRNEKQMNGVGMRPNPTSGAQAPISDQVINILGPALTAIDKSSLSSTVEMDAEVWVDFDPETGEILDIDEIEHDGLITGVLRTGDSPSRRTNVLDESGEPVRSRGKQLVRVVVLAEEGQKAIFPSWAFERSQKGSDNSQKMTIPPGSLRLVERRDDGTIVLSISAQKTAKESLRKLEQNIKTRKRNSSKGARRRYEKVERAIRQFEYYETRKNPRYSGKSSRPDSGFASGADKPEFPRKPTYGAFIGGAEQVFGGARTWAEFAEIYRDKEIVWLDYETTGLVFDEFRQPSSNGKPVQLGLIKMKNGVVIDRINLFMNPGEPLQQWSKDNLRDSDGNPLTDEWLSGQMSIADAHRAIAEFAGPEAIFGVQNASFDKDVLEDALTGAEIDWRPFGYIDTKEISDMVLPKWNPETQDGPFMERNGEKKPSNSLSAITKYLGVELGEKHHYATDDAEAAGLVMQAIVDRAERSDWSTDVLSKSKRDEKKSRNDRVFSEKLKKFNVDKENWLASQSGQEGSGFASGAGTPAGIFPARRAQNIRAQEKRFEDSENYVTNLEEAIRVLEERGEWIGGDLGIVLASEEDYRAESINKQGVVPKNATREQVEADGLEKTIDRARAKLDRAKKEAELQRFNLESKQKRQEQGTIDLEDIPESVIEELAEEAKLMRSLGRQERREMFQPGLDDGEVAVVHVGASELDGGVLDPSRTSGSESEGGAGSLGNTGALNESTIRRVRSDVEQEKERALAAARISDSPSDIFVPSTMAEVSALEWAGFRDVTIGSEVDISGRKDRIRSLGESLMESAQRKERPLIAASRGGKFGFLSAVAFDGDVISAGYFGRDAGKKIPNDVATIHTEHEKANLRKRDEIKDRFMHDRWMANLRGSAYLVIGQRDEDVTSTLGPSGEWQILGTQKPAFSFSGRVEDRPLIDRVGPALMARAIKIRREGREATPEAVLAERLSPPDEESGFSSGLRRRAANRMIDEILERIGADKQTSDRVKLGVNLAFVFSTSGPAGLAAVVGGEIARRAGREAAVAAAREALERGYINQSQYNMIMKKIDQVAPDGLPDVVKERAMEIGGRAVDVARRRLDRGGAPAISTGRGEYDDFGPPSIDNPPRSGVVYDDDDLFR